MNVLVFALATWRLSFMLVKEEGPFAIFQRMRVWARATEIDEAKGRKPLFPLHCIYCTSVWVSAGLLALSYTEAGLPVALWLAFSAITIMIQTAYEKVKGA